MTLKTENFSVNVGPQHPSTHGVFRMRLTLDGEVIVDVEMVLGYLHRGIEKLAESRNYTHNIPFTDRLDYLSSMTNNQAYVMAVEKLACITVPERAEYIRVIMAELQRIAAHLAGNQFLDLTPQSFRLPFVGQSGKTPGQLKVVFEFDIPFLRLALLAVSVSICASEH